MADRFYRTKQPTAPSELPFEVAKHVQRGTGRMARYWPVRDAHGDTVAEFTSPDIAGRFVGAVNAHDNLHTALNLAIGHIEHMARFVEAQRAGYSFESLNEDLPGIRAIAKTEQAKGASNG